MGNLMEELKEIELKRAELKQKLVEEKAYRKANKDKIKAERDAKVEEIDERLKAVLKVIFQYNKLGKVKKSETDILDTILQLVAKDEQVTNEVIENGTDE